MRDETRKCCAISKFIADADLQRAMRAKADGNKRALCALIEPQKAWCKDGIRERMGSKANDIRFDFERTKYGILLTAYQYLD